MQVSCQICTIVHIPVGKVQPGRRDLLEHVRERQFEDVVGEAPGVFVHEPEGARVEPGTVVGAVGADEGGDDRDFRFG